MIEGDDRAAVVAVEDAVRETVEPAGITAEFNGDAEWPPPEQGASERVALRVDLSAAVRLKVLPENLLMVCEELAVAVAQLLQESRRALDVGKQERDRPSR